MLCATHQDANNPDNAIAYQSINGEEQVVIEMIEGIFRANMHSFSDAVLDDAMKMLQKLKDEIDGEKVSVDKAV